MLYLHEQDLTLLGINWHDTIGVIASAIEIMALKDYDQPIKPYVRFSEPRNRIIAMPAYIGGSFSLAGIKWIASFPGNLAAGLPRAHSVTVLNNALTGKPECIINTSLISVIRTVSLSGFILKKYLENRNTHPPFDIGIVGFGPIGRFHLKMMEAVMGERIGKVYIYDTNGVDQQEIPPALQDRLVVCNNWETPYQQADIFLTATVSSKGYIEGAPKKGSLQLNISLRDYKPAIMQYADIIIVDDWNEVCRENTDIEVMHRTAGLQQGDTLSIAAFYTDAPPAMDADDPVIMFNPMGMAIFDIAMGGHYFQKALENGIGTPLKS